MPELSAQPDSQFWQQIPALELWESRSGAPPQQGTSIRAAWDSRELRILFDALDSHPWATLTTRDAPLYTEEVVEVFIDPVGDLEIYFEIEVNPLNTVMDLVIRKTRSGYRKDFAWCCEDLQTKVAQHSTGWSAEISLPFASLVAEAPMAGSTWRVNFCRIDRPEGVPRELSAWSPTFRETFHTPERFGLLSFAHSP